MAHPYVKYAHTKDPSWVKNLNKYVVPTATDKDVQATLRNNGGDASTTKKAAYVPLERGEDD